MLGCAFASERFGIIDYFLLFFGEFMDHEKYPPIRRRISFAVGFV